MRRLAAAGLAALAAVFLLFEIYLRGEFAAVGAPSPLGAESDTPGSTYRGGALGYGPVKNRKIESKKTAGGKVVYDVVYTIDENGFRRTPLLPAASPAVVFLGDSFTFGEGVKDDEAFPAVFQSASGLKAINLAYRGYAPHQMLRLLETGRERPATARYRPVMAFLLLHPDQVNWTAGNAIWFPRGPHYEVGADGSPRYLGTWPGRRAMSVVRWLYGSAVVRWCAVRWAKAAPRRKKEDIERFVAIVAELQRVFKERYRGDFQVLVWDRRSEDAARQIAELLRRRGVAVRMLTGAVPELDRPELYYFDGHPDAKIDLALGHYLARLVAGRKGRP